MPQAIPLAAAVFAAAEGYGAIATALLVGGASMVSGFLQQAMYDKPDAPALQQRTQGLKTTSRSTQEPLRPIYGTMLVGGNDVFVEATGADNKELWMVQTLAEGECEGIAQVNGVDQIFLDGKLWNEFGGNVQYWFFNGSATQNVCPALNAAIPKWTDCLRHTCYIVFKLTFDRDHFNSFPKRTVLLKGRKLYDFRTGLTDYSENHALALYDFLTSTLYGMGKDSAIINLSSWTSTGNYIDAKGWKFHFALPQQGAEDTITEIRRHFRGALTTFDSQLFLRYADLNYEAVAMVLDDEHIARDGDGRAQLSMAQPSHFGKADALRAKFIDPTKNYATDDVPVGDELGVVQEIQLLGSQDRQHVGEITTYELERQLLDMTIAGLFRDDCQQLDPHDLVLLSSTSLAISSQFLRVQQADIQPNGQVQLSFIYEAVALYNQTYDITPEAVYTCNLPDRTVEPPGVGSVQIAEENYSYRLRTFTRLNVSYVLPASYPWFDHVEVWLSLDSGLTYTHQFDTTSAGFLFDSVEEGKTYQFRLITVSIHNKRTPENLAPVVSHTVQGRDDAPASLASLEVAIGDTSSVRAYSAPVADADVDTYEFRLGSTWSGGIFLAAMKAPNLPLPGVKPGNFTIFANTRGSNGLYGTVPRSVSLTISDPPDHWSVLSITTGDYSAGTFTNAGPVSYGGESYLKCSHTGGVLTGSYKSAVIDRGASGRYLTYILADVAVAGEGMQWDDLLSPGQTWAEVLAVGQKWRELWMMDEAPTVKMRLWYGDTNPPANVVERMEILSTIVEGQYFQVEIEIIDPLATTNALMGPYALKLCQ